MSRLTYPTNIATETTIPLAEATAALIRKAQGILQVRIREAYAQYKQYRVHSCLDSEILMRRQAEGCRQVTVNPVRETCSCIEHAPATAEKPAGIVVRTRQMILAAGISRIEALAMGAWPQCKHELTAALLEAEYPEIFDRMGEFGRTAGEVEKARCGGWKPDTFFQVEDLAGLPSYSITPASSHYLTRNAPAVKGVVAAALRSGVAC